MNRRVRFYKKLLDYTFILTFVFLVLLVILLVIGMLLNAYDFSNITSGFMRSGYVGLQIAIVVSVAGMLISIILARVFLAAMQRAETLESAEDLRRQKQRRKQAEAKLNIKEEKPSSIAFSQTDTYKQIKKEEETEPEEVSISIIDEVLAKEEPVEKEADPVVEVEKAPEPKPVVNKEYYTRVTKGDLIKKVAENTDISEYKVKKFIKALLDEIKDQLAAKSEVKIDDFGRFYTKLHKEREAINPQTFEPIKIEAYNAVKFSAYKAFTEMITLEVKDTAKKSFVKEETEPVKEEVKEEPVPVVEEVKEEPVPVVEEVKEEPVVVPVVQKPTPKKKVKPGKKTKIDIINLLDETTDLSKNKANKFLKYFAQVIKETLAAKESVKIDDFGTFTTIVIPEKEGVNPITSEKIVVEAHTQVRLRFDKKFKQKFKEE